MTDGFKAMATRIENAETAFITYAMAEAGLTEAQATTALATMKKAKVLKIDPVMGQWNVKHGAFLEPDVLRRAAGLEEK